MGATAAGWIDLCAAAMLLASRAPAAEKPWLAAEQPELKQALEGAPDLKTESLGEPARGVNVWKRWLVRIDPQDARVHVVGRISLVGYPTFIGRDVYLSGPEQLRRIRNIVPAPPPGIREGRSDAGTGG